MNWEKILQLTYCDSIETLKLTERLCKQAIADGVQGDFAEAGVANGGHCIVMNSVSDGRKTWLLDSFEGISEYTKDDIEFTESWGKSKGNKRKSSGITVHSIENVKTNLQQFSNLDRYEFVKGWFCDTLPNLPDDLKLSVLRIDCDIYHAYQDCLKYLYPRLQVGGWLIIDDYHLSGCKKALDEAGLINFEFVNGIAYMQKTGYIIDEDGTDDL